MHTIIKTAIAATLSLASQHAWAIENSLVFGGHLASSLRYFETDFERGEDQFEPTNNGSSLFLKALAKGQDGLGYVYWEYGLKNEKSGIPALRQLFISLDTNVGSLQLGRKASEYRLAGERVDPFYDTSIVGFNGRANAEGASYGLSNLTNGYSRNMIGFRSAPIFGESVSINWGYFINDRAAPNNKDDANIGITYTKKMGEGSGVVAGIQYLDIRNAGSFAAGNSPRNRILAVSGSPGISENIRATLAYTSPKFSLGASVENIDVAAEDNARHYYYTSATYAFNETLRGALAYGFVDVPANGPKIQGDGLSLGFFKKMGAQTNGYIAARKVRISGAGETVGIAVGLAINFDVNLYPFSLGGGAAAE